MRTEEVFGSRDSACHVHVNGGFGAEARPSLFGTQRPFGLILKPVDRTYQDAAPSTSATPAADDQIPAHHAAEMSKMRHPRLGPGHAERQLDACVEGDKQPCRQRNGREQEYQDPVRKEYPVGEQYPKYAAGRTHRWINIPGQMREQQLCGPGRQDAGEIQLEQRAPPQQVFQFPAEHPQTVHVESEVKDTGVQECIGHELPRHEPGLQRPQGKTAYQRPGGIGLQQEYDNGDDDKGLNSGRLGTHG